MASAGDLVAVRDDPASSAATSMSNAATTTKAAAGISTYSSMLQHPLVVNPLTRNGVGVGIGIPQQYQFHPSHLDHSTITSIATNGFCPNPSSAAAWIHPAFVLNSINQAAFAKFSLRKGKWTEEEELYTKKLIDAFNTGYLRIGGGTTLRSFLAERLFWYVSRDLHKAFAFCTNL